MKVSRDRVDERMARLKAACREEGIKLTHQRLEIFREVASSLDHPDAEAVFRGVRPRLPTVSLDTVYRTLWLLQEAGLVQTLGPRREAVRFDGNPERHHHFVCERCGLVRDFTAGDLDDLPVPEAARQFGTVTAARVEMRGVCGKCARKSRAKAT